MKIKTLTYSLGLLAISSLMAQADLIHQWTLNNTTNDAVIGSTNYCIFKVGSTVSNATFTSDSPFGTNYSSVNLDQTQFPGCNLSVFGSADGSGSMEPPQMTYAVWVKANNGWFANASGVFSKGGNSGARVIRASATATNSILQFLGNTSGNGNVTDTKAVNIADGNWHHVAFTWDGTNVIYYIDGGQVGSRSTNTTPSLVYSNSFANLLYIGSLGVANYFNGRFSDFRIYNTALPAWQIASLTNQPSTVLFSDNFNAAISTNLFDPTGRATGTLATNTVYYAWTDTNNVDVNGTLNWAADLATNGLNELITANGNQLFRFGSSSNSGYFDWYPYVSNQVWNVEYDTLTGNSQPLNLGVTSTTQNGSWASPDLATYDFGFGNVGTACRWDIFNQAGTASNNIPNIFPSRATVYHVRVQFNELLNQVTMYVNGTQVAQTNNMVFAANHRYLSWGEPGKFGGYLDNVQISVEPSIPVAPFAVIPAPSNLIPNGNFTQVANAVLGSGAVANNYNLNGSRGDYSAFWGSTADVIGWSPYYSDPNGLTTNCVPFTDNPSYVLNGTYYLDTLINLPATGNTITLNSADYYLNGLIQTNILNGATIKSGAQYQFVVTAGATANTEQYYALFAAGLTVGSGVNATNPATAVPNSSFSIWAQTIPTSASSATTNITSVVSGTDLLTAQGSGPVNVIVNQMNTNGIAGYPTNSPNPTDISQVSQVKVYGVSLKVLIPTNDLNHDGVVDQADVNLAQTYLNGNGGESATNRENALINTYGYTPQQALAYLNLTAFDINGNNYFDASDVAALQAIVGPVTPPTLNYTVVAPGQIQFDWTGAFKLQWQTNALSTGLSGTWVDYPDTNNPVTVNIDPTVPTAFFRLSQ
jgi:hypothetical protein